MTLLLLDQSLIYINLLVQGPLYGYFVSPVKTWIIVKPEFLDAESQFFQDSFYY